MSRFSGLSCFKAYDVRGRVPEELNEELAYLIGRAFAALVSPSTVVIGRDARLSSPGLSDALSQGLISAGVDVIDLGLCGTEEVYFASFSLDVDGGIMVTASHNPPEYNGMKFVTKGARPISSDSGLRDIEEMVMRRSIPSLSTKKGSRRFLDNKPAYIDHILSYIDKGSLAPLKVVVNAGNGCAGPVVDLLRFFLRTRYGCC